MGKKTNTTNSDATSTNGATKPQRKTTKATAEPIAKPKPKTTKARTVKPKGASVSKKGGVRKAAAPRKFTQDDIALRAYFIAENRRRSGLPGDEHSDWLEAERQLLAEWKGSASK